MPSLAGRGVRGGGCAASLILCCRSQGFFEKGCRAFFESSSYLYLEPLGANTTPSPPIRGDVGNDRFRAEGGVKTRCLIMRSSSPGLFRLPFGILISRRWKHYTLRTLWPYHSKEPSQYVRAPSFIRLIVVLMLSTNSILFLGR